jgi:hypothetical protein
MSFLNELTGIINSGQSRCVVLTGNIYDLFFDGEDYVPLMSYLSKKYSSLPNAETSTKGITQVIYELNNAISVCGDDDQKEDLNRTWSKVSGSQKGLEDRLAESGKNSTYALQLLHKICECSRLNNRNAANNLLVMIEAADMLLPEEQISRMSLNDRKRVAIVKDWFSEPEFMDGPDSVILLSESRSGIHSRISRMPQVLSVEIPLPDITERTHFVTNFGSDHGMTFTAGAVAVQTAGLSIHAIRQLMLSGDLSPDNIASKVEEYMISQLGEGVIEFKRPSHSLEDCIGNTKVKTFLKEELIPGFQDGTIAGAAVGGPIGGGKTFICEAAAAEVGCPVVLLKSIRSKWFGETDAIFERLYRLLKTFNQIMIFVDEADAQFGDIDGGHATERRLTGKIQAMMSDPKLLGKVIWFLMTARIHRLSADIRRPGRMDIIIPILDPKDQDRIDFITWTFKDFKIARSSSDPQCEKDFKKAEKATEGYSAAAFAVLKRRIKRCSTIDEAIKIADDMVLPDIQEVREYQTLQAKLNCTRKSLVFDDTEGFNKKRSEWKKKIAELEKQGIN